MIVRNACVAALVCTVASCKSSPAQDDGRPAPITGPTASAVSLAAGGWTSNQACALIDRADVARALGEEGLGAIKTPADGEQKDSPTVNCTYNRGSLPGFVRVTIDVPSRHRDFGTIYPPEIASTPVPGVGDAAFQSESSSTGFVLYVKKGDVTFWVQAQTSDRGEKDKTLVRTIAKKAAARL